jgi:hypothetical protein
MKHYKITAIIGGVALIFIFTGLAWNYTEAIKEKNTIERMKVESTKRIEEENLRQEVAKSNIEFQQKEKCLKLKQDLEAKLPKQEGVITAEDDVLYNNGTCYLYNRDLRTFPDGKTETFETIIDLLKEKDIIWYPSAGRWTYDEFQTKKKELGF